MPELPEIEHLLRTLVPQIVGRRVRDVAVSRRDVVRAGRGRRTGRLARRDLLHGAVIASISRLGKQLAIESDDGRVVCVHLGMSGQLRFLPGTDRLDDGSHVHCTWTLGPRRADRRGGRLVFRDPRRFGGLWLFPSPSALRRARWDRLGPDALEIDPSALGERLAATRRPVKAALLDQSVVAGLGNIYIDEALFDASIHPRRPADRLDRPALDRLAASIRVILGNAITAGGSTIRDYVDADGMDGGYSGAHRVYGRAGRPCPECGRTLRSFQLAQRTTVACSRCQPPPRQRRCAI